MESMILLNKSSWSEEKFACGVKQLIHPLSFRQFGRELQQLQVLVSIFNTFLFGFGSVFCLNTNFCFELYWIVDETERMWSTREAVSKGNITLTALPRLHYFRCLLNNRGVPAAPVDNWYARRPPTGPGSCYAQWSKSFHLIVLYVMSLVWKLVFEFAILNCVLLN